MDALLEKMLTNGSPLVVLVVIVYVFLKHIKENNAEMRELLKQFHGEHILARKETTDAVEKNTSAMMENTMAVRALAESVRACPLKEGT